MPWTVCRLWAVYDCEQSINGVDPSTWIPGRLSPTSILICKFCEGIRVEISWGEQLQFLLWYRATLSPLCKLSLFGQSKFSFFLSDCLLDNLNFPVSWQCYPAFPKDTLVNFISGCLKRFKWSATFQFCKLGTAPKQPLLRGPKRAQIFPVRIWSMIISSHDDHYYPYMSYLYFWSSS